MIPQPSLWEKAKTTITNILFQMKSHKKMVLYSLAALVLFIILVTSFVSLFIKKEDLQKILPPAAAPNKITVSEQQSNRQEKATLARMSLIPPKSETPIKVGDLISLTVVADSASQPITAADVVVRFNKEAVSFEKEINKVPDQFLYHRKLRDNTIYLTLLQKLNSQKTIFTSTILFELQFKALKTGEANFEIMLNHNIKSDSNLITKNDSLDILTYVYGTTITIK